MRQFTVNRSRSLSVLVVLSLVAGFLWAASRADGYVTPEPDLHDAGIWVTRTDQRRVGRTNTEIHTVDTSLSLASEQFDVLQAGATVIVRQAAPSQLVGINPVTASPVPGPELPTDAQVVLGGGTGALYDPNSGALFVTTAEGVLGVQLDGEESPTAEVEGGVVAAGTDGLVHALDADGGITTWSPDGLVVAERLVDLEDGSRPALATVGATPVVLDEETATVSVGGEVVGVEQAGTTPRIQQSGPAAAGVLVAGDGALVRVDLESGDVTTLVDGGVGPAAAPVWLGGCAYTAWSGNGLVARVCDGQEPETRTFEQFATGGELAWRVNRDRILLNELVTGRQLVYGEGEPEYVDDWSDALTEEPDTEQESDETAADAEEQPIDRTKNDPPVVNDDTAGTREGRPVVVRPLRNDTDPDGDVLVVSELGEVSEDVGRAQLVDGGRGVLVELAPGTSTMRFGYTVSDGNGHTVDGTVSVELVPETTNRPPEAAPGEETTVVAGGTVVHNVLANAFDPDGDPISVLQATAELAGDVPFEGSGDLLYQATNAVEDDVVTYVLVDDRAAQGSGMLDVSVVPADTNQPPVARSDFAETIVGREVVLDLLDNDSDANGDDLTLVRVDDYSNANVTWEPGSPDVRVEADRAGTVNLVYTITDGQKTDQGLVRVDVAEPGSQFPPVAVRDDVRLAPGIPAFVSVLDNDVDRDGEVLVVTGVEVPSDAPIDVQLINRTQLRIESAVALADVVEFDYRISDGSNDAVGRVVVTPAPVREQNQPPVVGPDEFTVRAGGIAVLPVLGNDSDPDGDAIELVDPDVGGAPDAAAVARDGRLFLSGGQLRYEAPAAPKPTIIGRTTIVDSAANTASGQLLLHVIPADGSTNNAPVAPTLIGRVLAGGRVEIDVPLATMDPEGDAVQLVGVGTPPRLGAVTEVEGATLVYDADASSAGTDQFSYIVRDQFGLEAEGAVLVGVAGTSTSNNDPSAGDDPVNVVPGTTVDIPVLANDSDPDGDRLRVSREADDVLAATVGSVSLNDDDTISFSAPPDAQVGGETAFRYVVSDGRGGRDAGTVVVSFVEELPNRAPEPVDDRLAAQVMGELFTTEPLQANDLDADGDALEVTSISLSAEVATLNPDGSVQLTMPDTSVQFTYEVTDGTDTRRGVVVVPLVENLPPVAGLDEATVDMLDAVTIDVLDNDADPEGAELVLLDVIPGSVRNGVARVEGDAIVFEAATDEFVGDAGFSYRVADSADPTVALTSVGVVQVTIEGTLNTAPTFTSLTVDVPQTASRTVDLASAVVDPDEQTHTFTDLVGGGDGLRGSIADTTLVVEAATDAVVGTVQEFRFVVDDGKATTAGSVVATVVGSERPLTTTVVDVAETDQGAPISIPVLANDVNPYPETPLRLLDVTSVAGASVSIEGDSVRFAPDPDQRKLGEVSFEYRVGDATEDASREVTGTVNVTVIGRPDIPAAPTCIGGESKVVQIGWAAPAANGAPITEYRVRVQPEGGAAEVRTFRDGSTVQLIDGLENAVTYTFAVAAINSAVDEPEFSPPSPSCKPDQVPDKAPTPATVFGDGELDITWGEPTVDGSDIERLYLTNTTTGEVEEFGPTVRQHTATGLENGTSYRFTLVAENEKGRGPVSDLSTGDSIPAGPPLNPVAPTTEKGDRFLTVNWQRPDENGDAITAYRITIIRDGVEAGQVSINNGSRFSTQIDTDNGVNYEFQLEARNKAGWSERSPRSAVAVSAGRPFPVSSVSASEGDTNSTLTFSAPDDNGAAITGYQVSINGGSFVGLAGDRVVRSLSNGTNYSFRVRAVNAEGTGDPSPASNTINPYGKPGTPSVSSSRSGTTITWTWGAVSGNGRSVTRYEVNLDGGGYSSNGTSTSYSRSFGYDQTHTLQVRAVTNGADSARAVGNAGSRSETIPRQTWDLTTNETTCPEKDNVSPSNYRRSDASCNRDGAGGFIANGTTYTYQCRRDFGRGWTDGSSSSTWWVKRNGMEIYVYEPHLTGSRSGMPTC